MIRYTVTQTIQTGSNPAVPVNWYKGTDQGEALAALTGAATRKDDDAFGSLPEHMRYRVLDAKITHEVLPDPDVLTYTVDFTEDGEFALSDCAWWDNQYQPWARVECYGRMAHVTMLKNGHAVMGAVLCEGHVNAYNDGKLHS